MRPVLLGAVAAVAVAGSAPVPPPVAPGGHTHVVEIRGFTFSPARMVVAAGDTVEWINRDAAPHTATGGGGAWDSGELATGTRWRLVPADTGRVPYLCAYHPSMRGELIVRASPRGPEEREVES